MPGDLGSVRAGRDVVAAVVHFLGGVPRYCSEEGKKNKIMKKKVFSARSKTFSSLQNKNHFNLSLSLQQHNKNLNCAPPQTAAQNRAASPKETKASAAALGHSPPPAAAFASAAAAASSTTSSSAAAATQQAPRSLATPGVLLLPGAW